MMPRPLSSASCFISRIFTGTPAFRKFIAMPPPIVPAPMMATLLMSRVAVSSGMPGILEAARSAKNAWRSALLSGVSISAEKASRSYFMPSSNLALVACSTQSTQRTGAGKFLAIALTVLRAKPK